MTRCKVCGCKLRDGDLCRRCEYEQDWRNTPEYFCTSSNCQKLLPGATEPGLCDACKKLAQIPYKPLKKPIKIEEKPETKPEIQEEIAVEKTEKCNDCKTPITARRKSQSGLCERCFGRQWARKRAQARADAKITPAVAPKTGAEKAEPITEPAASTIHAAPPPKPVIAIEESDVCRRAILQYGMSRQICKAAEECAELAAAISRHFATEGSTAEVISEIADVEIMCVQLRMIFGADLIDTARAEKVARLHGRLRV